VVRSTLGRPAVPSIPGSRNTDMTSTRSI
jgi:hypothetical protein